MACSIAGLPAKQLLGSTYQAGMVAELVTHADELCQVLHAVLVCRHCSLKAVLCSCNTPEKPH